MKKTIIFLSTGILLIILGIVTQELLFPINLIFSGIGGLLLGYNGMKLFYLIKDNQRIKKL